MKPYKDQKLTWDQKTLRDEQGQAVMMDWEAPIMKLAAQTICQNGGRVLNVGFGMGLIDGYIEEENIDEHWIIEMHPDVLEHMRLKGWYDKPHVRILEGPWQEHLETLPEFDGIYIDTWDEPLTEFLKNAHKFLKPDGIFSFFNNNYGWERKFGGIDPEAYYIMKDWANIEVEGVLELEEIASPEEQGIQGRKQPFYWNPKLTKYYNPKVTKKRN